MVWGSGEAQTIIEAHNKKTDGTNVTNYLYVIAKKDGTKSYAVSDPAAFRSAIGAGTSSTNTTYTIATGDSNGQIKVTPSSGSAYNVSVKGLGSAAYLNADTAASANTVVKRDANKYIYATYYNSNIGNEDINGYTNDVAVMFTSNDKWIRRTSRLNFAKYLTNQQIASPGYFVTLTNSWGSFGYSTPAQARSGLGLKGCATQSISYHTVACNIPSGSQYKDYSVTYSSRTVDAVIPCIWTGTTSQVNVCIPVITNVTSTSTTIRVWKQVGATTNNPEPSLKVLIVYH